MGTGPGNLLMFLFLEQPAWQKYRQELGIQRAVEYLQEKGFPYWWPEQVPDPKEFGTIFVPGGQAIQPEQLPTLRGLLSSWRLRRCKLPGRRGNPAGHRLGYGLPERFYKMPILQGGNLQEILNDPLKTTMLIILAALEIPAMVFLTVAWFKAKKGVCYGKLFDDKREANPADQGAGAADHGNPG